jgi:cytochrome P450
MSQDSAVVTDGPGGPGCPFGGFDPFGADAADPYPALRRARAGAPVFYSSELRAWCVTRYEDIADVLRDDRNFSAREHNPEPPPNLPDDVKHVMATWRGTETPMGSLDPPRHTRVRAVANTGFTPRALRTFEPRVREAARRRVAGLAGAARFEFISEFSRPFALDVILDVLGVPAAHHEQYRVWTEQRMALVLRRDLSAEEARENARALLEYAAFVRELVDDRLARPTGDLISYMLHESPQGERLSREEVIAQVPTLITAGHETSTQALATILLHQMRAPLGWKGVAGGTVPIADTVEEGLRYDPSIFGMFRTTLHEVTVGGTVLPAGSKVLLLYGSGNHDEERFDCPEEFRPGRDTSAQHLAFGRGVHFCIGAPLARMELRIAIEELAAAMPGLALDEEPQFRSSFPLRALRSLWLRP